jgi:predicted ATP-grasp superfamily ATP-dependent carboligase
MDLDGFVAGLNRAIADVGYDVILPSSDLDMLALSQERERIDAKVPYGPHDGVVRALDKLDSTEAAEKVGLHVPWTRLTDDEGLSAIAPGREVIVKARRHTFLDRGVGTHYKVATVCRGREEAIARARLIASEGGQGVVQERLTGRLVALSLVADRRSRVVGRMYQVAHASWPEPVGGTARGITEAIDEDLATRAEALLAELGWFGLAQIQFLLGSDGEPYFIDFNGRIYGSIALGVGAGLNLPAIWADLAIDREPARSVDARVGVRYQWFEADLKRAILSGPRSFLPQLRDALAYARGATHSVWSLRDPLPAVIYAGMLTRRLFVEHVRRSSRGDGSPSS